MIAIDSCLEIMVVAYIGFMVNVAPSSGEVLGYYIIVFGLVLVLVVLPSSVVCLMRQKTDEEELHCEDNHFHKRCGQLIKW